MHADCRARQVGSAARDLLFRKRCDSAGLDELMTYWIGLRRPYRGLVCFVSHARWLAPPANFRSSLRDSTMQSWRVELNISRWCKRPENESQKNIGPRAPELRTNHEQFKAAKKTEVCNLVCGLRYLRFLLLVLSARESL